MLENILQDMKLFVSQPRVNQAGYLQILKSNIVQAEADLSAAKYTMLRAICHDDKMYARKISSLLKVLVS